MTYRNGAFVVDTRESRVALVVDSMGKRVHVRAPGGGEEWEVPFTALRLATREERETAGLWPQMARSPIDCETCPELSAAYREAEASGDKVRTGAAVVAQRSHWRREHGL
ncbi:hypothetical protein [Streptomyces sp. NPDC002537]